MDGPGSNPPETWPHHAPDELEAVRRVLASGHTNYWTGQEARHFEEEFAAYVGVPHAIALANGTVALEAALLALGIGPGDEVIVPARTFVATAGAVVSQGARPLFADVDRESGNITAATIADVLTPCTRAVIAVHLGGWPCEMAPILELARRQGLFVIEDCAQSHGARYRGRPVGSLGDIAAFSFCQDKIMTIGGEGGMVTTGDKVLWQTVWSHKDHGKTWNSVYEREHAPGFRWLHDSFGSNWRLTESQAAIGRVQLGKLDNWVECRRRNARLLTDHLAELSAIRIPTPPEHVRSSFYRLYVYVQPDRLRPGWTRDRILGSFAERGIPSMSGSCPEIYLERCFMDTGLAPAERLHTAHELGETSLAFFVHPTLSKHTIDTWGQIAREVLIEATFR